MPEIQCLTEKEFRKINFWFEKEAHTYFEPYRLIRNELLILLMLDAGLRVGEAVQLKWFCIVENHKVSTFVIVNAQIAKNKIARRIPLTDKLIGIIEQHYEYESVFKALHPTDYVFASRISKSPLGTRQARRIVRFTFKSAIGRDVHPHELRHTFATRLMRVTNTRIVQELMGHKKLTSTQIYTHPNSDDLRKAIDKLD